MLQIELYYSNDLFIVDFYHTGQIYEIYLISESLKEGSLLISESQLSEECLSFLRYETNEYIRNMDREGRV